MSSFLWPDSATRKLFNQGLFGTYAPKGKWYQKRKLQRSKKESIMARAQRLTEEKGLIREAQTTQQVKGTFTKMVSKVKNFITNLFNR